MIAGGSDAAGSVASAELALFTEHDYRGASAPAQPSISSVNGVSSFPVPVSTGAVVIVSGSNFIALSEGSEGFTHAQSAVNLPRAYLRSMDAGSFWGSSPRLVDVSTSVYLAAISSTSLSFTVPSSLSPGYYLFWLQTGAVPSDAKILSVASSASGATVVSARWTTAGAGTMISARYNPTATLLPNGKVLVAGGSNGTAFTTCELYDPVAGSWSATGSLEFRPPAS